MDRRTELTRATWVGLSRTWILGVTGGAVLLLFFCAIFVQQMPGQLRDDPAEAARWLLMASEQYGALGNVLRTLGLFSVLHNPLLQLLLMMIALVLLIQLGNVIAATWRLHRVPRRLHHAVTSPGEPIPLAAVQPVYRLRQAINGAAPQLIEQLRLELSLGFPEQASATLMLPTAPRADDSTSNEETVAGQVEQSTTAINGAPRTEERMLVRRHLRYALLRPLLLIGLFVALVAVWLSLIAGWEVTAPLLAPGDEYHQPEQQLTVRYTLPVVDEQGTPTLQVAVGETVRQLPLDRTLRSNWGQLAIATANGPPALLIQSADDAPVLAQPGQTQTRAAIGVPFPNVGSEESVVVDQTLYLRLVRLLGTSEQPGITAFWVEVYQVGTDDPVLRLEVADRSQEVITVEGNRYVLNFVPLPSVVLNVRYQPGVWLLGLALLLVVIGAIGYWQRPAFLLVQAAPWPDARTVLVIQSDVAAELQRVRVWLAQQQTGQQEHA